MLISPTTRDRRKILIDQNPAVEAALNHRSPKISVSSRNQPVFAQQIPVHWCTDSSKVEFLRDKFEACPSPSGAGLLIW
ncbi:MAG: hypothetical protein AAB482_03930 [Patescibacteria group bacterium]